MLPGSEALLYVLEKTTLDYKPTQDRVQSEGKKWVLQSSRSQPGDGNPFGGGMSDIYTIVYNHRNIAVMK